MPFSSCDKYKINTKQRRTICTILLWTWKRYLSPPLFAVVSSEVRSGLPSELLYSDDLVLMALSMEQLDRRVAEWRVSLLDKGQKVSKVMVSVGK